MWYALKRTWPSLLKTAMVCGTICFVSVLVFSSGYPAAKAESGSRDPVVRRRLDRLELTVSEMLAGVPVDKIRNATWDPTTRLLVMDQSVTMQSPE